MAVDPRLATLRRLTGRRSRVDHEWKQAIHDARAAGLSLRKIATAAGVTHVRVIQILRGD